MPDASADGCTVKLNLAKGEIGNIAASSGSITSLSAAGSIAVFEWYAPLSGTSTTIVVNISTSSAAAGSLHVSDDDALRLLHLAGVNVDAELDVTSGTLRAGTWKVVFTETNGGIAADLPSSIPKGAVYELELNYKRRSAEGSAKLNGGFSFIEEDEVLRLSCDEDVCLVKFVCGGELYALIATGKGMELGDLPDQPELSTDENFIGWYDGETSVSELTKVERDLELHAGRSRITGYSGEEVRISNADGSLLAALGPGTDKDSVSIRLDGSDGSGNAGYHANGWSEDSSLYIISNCNSVSDPDPAYANTHVPLEELLGITVFAKRGGSTISLQVDADDLILCSDGSYRISGSGALSLAVGEDFAYMNGRGNGVFAPEAGITRAEAASLFYRCLTDTSRAGLTQTQSFYDVLPGFWYYDAVTSLAGAGMLNGRSASVFAPDEGITRAEFVALALRVLGTQPDSAYDMFNDVSRSWARGYINTSAKLGLIGGYPDGSFRPDSGITRAEAASIMNSLLERDAASTALPKYSPWADVAVTDWFFEDVMLATMDAAW